MNTIKDLIHDLRTNTEFRYGLLIGVYTVLLTLVPLADNLKIKNFKFGDKKTLKDRTIIFFRNVIVKTLLILILSGLIFVATRSKEKYVASKANSELEKRDSIRKLEDQKLTLSITEALTNAGYSIDSLTGKVRIMGNKIRKQTLIAEPSISFDFIKDSLINNVLYYRLYGKSNEAKSVVSINMSTGVMVHGKILIISQKNPLFSNITFQKDNGRFSSRYIVLAEVPDLLLYHFTGSFKGDSKFIHRLDEYCVYDLKENAFGNPDPTLSKEMDVVFKTKVRSAL